MSGIETLRESLPDYAKDLALNLSSVLRQTSLSPSQLWGSVLGAAIASRSATVLRSVHAECRSALSAEGYQGVRVAAALMGMNNIFYRFGHFCSEKRYLEMPAGLRMNALRSHGADPVDFELWCLVVSAVNGCGLCVDSHEKTLREKGVAHETIHAAVRVGAVIHAIAGVIEAEEALASS